MSLFAVVEFLNEKSVEVVAKKWIEKCDDIYYCYWPRTNASGKAKKCETPDLKTWTKYPVRVFTFTNNYDVALRRAKRAEVTSNLESDAEPETCGQRKRPSSGYFNDSTDSSDGGIHDSRRVISQTVAKVPRTSTAPDLPRAPVYQYSNSSRNHQCSSLNKERLATQSSTLPEATISEHVNGVADILMQDFNSINLPELFFSGNVPPLTGNSFRQSTFPMDVTPGATCGEDGQPRDQRIPTPLPKTLPSVRTSTPCSGKNSAPMRQDRLENFQRSVLTKLETIIQKQDEGLSMLRVLLGATRGVGGNDILDDILPKPMDSIDELEIMCGHLEEETFKKKLVNFLAALCGHSCADSARRIMAKLGTNKLWSLYSFKGKRGKLPFKNVILCRMVVKACLRVHKKASEVHVEEQLAECLKHAPHRPGGAKYKNCQTENREENDE